MKQRILVFLAVIAFGIWVRAESFVVTKAGKGFWVPSARKEAGAILYIDKDTGNESSIPVADVEAVIPKAQAGLQYPIDEVKAHVRTLKVLKQKHVGMTRVLNQLEQEWAAFLIEDPDFEKKIDEEVRRFKASDKLTRAYKEAAMNLGMFKYKDVHAKFTAKIDALIGEVKKDYCVAGFSHLEALSMTNMLDVAGFVAAKELMESLSDICDPEQKQKAVMFREKARLVALRGNTRLAVSQFASTRTLTAYLASHELLTRTRALVASEETHRKAIDGLMAGLISDAGTALPLYNFEFKGFPLTRNDRDMLTLYKSFSSRISWKSVEIEEQCLVIPLKQPGKIALNRHFVMPFRLVFNGPQPPDRKYRMAVYIPGVRDGGVYSASVPLEGVSVTNGHADITFVYDFNEAAEGFIPAASRDGAVYAYLTLERLLAPGEGAEESCPMSLACRFVM